MGTQKILLTIFAAFSVISVAQADNPVEINVGRVHLKIVLGEILDQDTEALVVSHWADEANDAGGIGGAIVDAGAKESLDQFTLIIRRNGGPLPYANVYPTTVPSDRGIKARYLLNMIELRPLNRILYTTPLEIASSIELSDFDKVEYTALVEKYAKMIGPVTARVNEAKADLRLEPTEENYRQYLVAARKTTGTDYEQRRLEITKKYEKQLSFFTVAESVYNTMLNADELNLESLTFSPVGYGITGNLTLKESLSAMLTGIKLYAMEDHAKNHELRIVAFSRDNHETREIISKNAGPLLMSGHFLQIARALLPSMNDSTDWKAVRANFIEHDLPTLKMTMPSYRVQWQNTCADFLRRWFQY